MFYNFISSQNASVTVRTDDASFYLDKLLVHGSFMTEVHLILRTSKGRFFNVSVRASELNEHHWGWKFVNGSCALPSTPFRSPGTLFTLGPHSSRRCDELTVDVDMSSVRIRLPEWSCTFRGMPVYDHVSGPMHRLDIVLDAKVSDDEFAVPPHGIIGQSFDGHGRPRKGKLDIYPPRSEPGEFWTKAMADWYNIVGEKAQGYRMLWQVRQFKHRLFVVQIRILQMNIIM